VKNNINCSKCGEDVNPEYYIYVEDYDGNPEEGMGHIYERFVGYECPNCGYEERED